MLPDMKTLLEHHIRETNRRFDKMERQQERVIEALGDMNEFKTKLIVSSRWVSLIVSSVLGLATMVGTGFVNYLIAIKK